MSKKKGYEVEVEKDHWIRLPLELTENPERIKHTIKALQLVLKVAEGKYVRSRKGVINRIKAYFLGYAVLK